MVRRQNCFTNWMLVWESDTGTRKVLRLSVQKKALERSECDFCSSSSSSCLLTSVTCRFVALHHLHQLCICDKTLHKKTTQACNQFRHQSKLLALSTSAYSEVSFVSSTAKQETTVWDHWPTDRVSSAMFCSCFWLWKHKVCRINHFPTVIVATKPDFKSKTFFPQTLIKCFFYAWS